MISLDVWSDMVLALKKLLLLPSPSSLLKFLGCLSFGSARFTYHNSLFLLLWFNFLIGGVLFKKGHPIIGLFLFDEMSGMNVCCWIMQGFIVFFSCLFWVLFRKDGCRVLSFEWWIHFVLQNWIWFIILIWGTWKSSLSTSPSLSISDIWANNFPQMYIWV